MLTVRDLATLPDLELPVAAGAKGLGNAVSWLHVSELADPTRWLEGGEFLLTTGLGLGEAATSQRAYVRRLAKHGIAGLGFGIGFGFAEVPAPVVQEADKLSFPVLAVPYEVPFVAITKSAFTHLANEQLEQQTRALAVHERLADAVIRGRGVQALLAIVCSHLDCSLALVDEHGRVLGERHARRRASFDDALELPVVADGEPATLRAAREGRPFEEYDLLVLHHGQTRARVRAVAAPRGERGRAAARRGPAGGPRGRAARRARDRQADGRVRTGAGACLRRAPRRASRRAERRAGAPRDRRGARPDGASATSPRPGATARPSWSRSPGRTRRSRWPSGSSRPGRRRVSASGGPRSAARSAGACWKRGRHSTPAGRGDVASYRDLGSLELLLSLPNAALEAFVDRVLGPAADSERLMDSLAALLDSGCRWSDAAEALGVHRHTLRYRMERLREQTGRHPDDPDERMELWLAVKATQALAARNGRSTAA